MSARATPWFSYTADLMAAARYSPPKSATAVYRRHFFSKAFMRAAALQETARLAAASARA